MTERARYIREEVNSVRLSKETKIKLHTNEAVAVAKMCYAASKLWKDGSAVWNADSVGAYNILRIYLRMQGLLFADSARCAALSSPTYIKVAV